MTQNPEMLPRASQPLVQHRERKKPKREGGEALTILQRPAVDGRGGHPVAGAGVGEDADAVVGVLLEAEDVGAFGRGLCLSLLICRGSIELVWRICGCIERINRRSSRGLPRRSQGKKAKINRQTWMRVGKK